MALGILGGRRKGSTCVRLFSSLHFRVVTSMKPVGLFFAVNPQAPEACEVRNYGGEDSVKWSRASTALYSNVDGKDKLFQRETHNKKQNPSALFW